MAASKIGPAPGNGASSKLGIIGGTGQLGFGLALRFSAAGYAVSIGSRDEDRARECAAQIANQTKTTLSSGDNFSVATNTDIIIVTVPFSAQEETLKSIRTAAAGKIVVDTTVPLKPPKVMRVQLPPAGSAGLRARELLSADTRLVSAFQNIAAAHLSHLDRNLEGDVLVSGDDKSAREEVIGLAEAIGLTAWHAGPLENSVVAEGLTSVLIFLNKQYSLDGAGIRISGQPRQAKSA